VHTKLGVALHFSGPRRFRFGSVPFLALLVLCTRNQFYNSELRNDARIVGLVNRFGCDVLLLLLLLLLQV
jgi:hypothetical protein